MSQTDSVFQRAVSKLLTEIFDGPPGTEAYILNPGDPGLHRQLETISAATASQQAIPGKPSIAAHVDHVHFGLSLLTRWLSGETPGPTPTGMEAGNAQPLQTTSGACFATVSARRPINGRRVSPFAPTGTTSTRQPLSPRLHTPLTTWVRSARSSERFVNRTLRKHRIGHQATGTRY